MQLPVPLQAAVPLRLPIFSCMIVLHHGAPFQQLLTDRGHYFCIKSCRRDSSILDCILNRTLTDKLSMCMSADHCNWNIALLYSPSCTIHHVGTRLDFLPFVFCIDMSPPCHWTPCCHPLQHRRPSTPARLWHVRLPACLSHKPRRMLVTTSGTTMSTFPHITRLATVSSCGPPPLKNSHAMPAFIE